MLRQNKKPGVNTLHVLTTDYTLSIKHLYRITLFFIQYNILYYSFVSKICQKNYSFFILYPYTIYQQCIFVNS
ncbi:hypothetical protein EKA14_08330 [Bacillus mycoides]|uniref:Uncharacterized protein n=1 Tax=Bacillus luti TaxID=2026191 RepID=A0A7V7SAC6_9BACI|nr:hypothetical protein F8163_05475 [Bacillus luti]RWS43736.1 hypothetical protein EKA14_08330 [Bacillus mycoides]